MKTIPRLAAFLTALLLAAACSSHTVAGPNGASPTPTTGAPAPRQSARPNDSASPGATVSAGQTPAPSPPPAGQADPQTPPAPGLYRYRQSGQTKAGTFTLNADPEGTLRIDPATLASGGQRQHQDRKFSNSRSREQVFLFRADAIYLEEVTSHFGGTDLRCHFDKPLRVIPLPLRVGARWKDTAHCQQSTITISGRFLRNESRRIGGTPVQTIVAQYTLAYNGGGVDQTSESTTWISADYRMIVRSKQTSQGSGQGVHFTETLNEDLVSLTPGNA